MKKKYNFLFLFFLIFLISAGALSLYFYSLKDASNPLINKIPSGPLTLEVENIYKELKGKKKCTSEIEIYLCAKFLGIKHSPLIFNSRGNVSPPIIGKKSINAINAYDFPPGGVYEIGKKIYIFINAKPFIRNLTKEYKDKRDFKKHIAASFLKDGIPKDLEAKAIHDKFFIFLLIEYIPEESVNFIAGVELASKKIYSPLQFRVF